MSISVDVLAALVAVLATISAGFWWIIEQRLDSLLLRRLDALMLRLSAEFVKKETHDAEVMGIKDRLSSLEK